MNREEAKLFAKDQLESFLQRQGIKTEKLFRCLCRDHEDRHASMSFHRQSNTVHCFACGRTLDVFGVVGEIYGLSGREMFEKTYSLLGITINGKTEKRNAAQRRPDPAPVLVPKEKMDEASDFTGYIEQCAKRAGETDYWKKRGLSAETIARFKLGFDPYYTRGTALPWKAAIIPTGRGSIGVAQVADMVEKHIAATGRTPVVVVDYLQILSPFDPRYSDKQNTDRAVVELKRLSRDRKTPIIAVSAFNRANSHTEVSFDAFRESSAIEYGSDVLIGLQLHGVGMEGFDVNAAKAATPRRIQAVVLKNRSGRTGDILCYEYYPMFNYFREK